jgi:hypothetical protein
VYEKHIELWSYNSKEELLVTISGEVIRKKGRRSSYGGCGKEIDKVWKRWKAVKWETRIIR